MRRPTVPPPVTAILVPGIVGILLSARTATDIGSANTATSADTCFGTSIQRVGSVAINSAIPPSQVKPIHS